MTYRREASGRSQVIVVVGPGGRVVGQLVYEVCHECRTGHIHSVAIVSPWQRRGLGREAVHRTVLPFAHYTWTTSRQSAAGRRFFAVLEGELDVRFGVGRGECGPAGGACPPKDR
ncbi:GNAT family N-acetyltransferase [Streptomyces sp. NPDC050418]|uniref:GNAT family N-acetyltransferase n=1 Tax=Streptomyces sp. NPDC050418 TaxID=3365612 RepID=UPI0037BB22E0